MSKNTFIIIKKKYFLLISCFCFIGIIFLAFSFIKGEPKQDLKKSTFDHITKIRGEKKQEVIDYFNDIKKQAQNISNDQQMLGFFRVLTNTQSNPSLEFAIDKHYVSSYGNFYDILFVNPKGDIFHSIKKETDYKKNIFTSEISDAKLAQSLKNPSDDGFVEYEYYPPSNEAAAFFTIALQENKKHMGWFVLQCEINNLNAILKNRKGLGRTGEVYLVNKDKLMLSESRFIGDSTILQLQVDTVAVKEALLFRKGEKITNDYRGVNVFSSFEMFDLFGSHWIILVEIDEDEVITEHFRKHQKYFVKEFIAYLGAKEKKVSFPEKPAGLRVRKVGMNEFTKSDNESYLVTEGVSTCTAIAISYPEKFGYLAHISPTDEIYIDNIFTKFILQENYHNFLSELIVKIKHFEVYPYELNELKFVIIATHTNSFAKAIDSILSHDIGLASITFMFNPYSQSSNVLLTPTQYGVHVQWNGEKQFFEDAGKTENLGTILKKIIQYDTYPTSPNSQIPVTPKPHPVSS